MWFSFKIWLLKHQSDSLFFHCKISQFLEIKSPDGYRRYKIPLCTKSDKSQFQGHLSTIVLLVHWKEILYEILTLGISFFCLFVCLWGQPHQRSPPCGARDCSYHRVHAHHTAQRSGKCFKMRLKHWHRWECCLWHLEEGFTWQV